MRVEVVIPYAGDCHHRARALKLVRGRYPWPVTIARGGTPWSKGAAVMPAVANSTADVVVAADGDVWADGVREAVRAVVRGAPWAIPHRGVLRLSEDSTARVLAGEPWQGLPLDERAYLGVPGGGVVVIHRALLLACPLDPRFLGWGQEDESWGWALTTLYGPPVRLKHPLVHLWHQPQQRMSRRRGSAENWQLRQRYYRARDDEQAMRQLLGEAQRDLATAHPLGHDRAA